MRYYADEGLPPGTYRATYAGWEERPLFRLLFDVVGYGTVALPLCAVDGPTPSNPIEVGESVQLELGRVVHRTARHNGAPFRTRTVDVRRAPCARGSRR